MQYLPKIIVGLVAAVQLAAVALPSSASAEQLKKIAILPKTLVNDVFQIRIVKAAEGEAIHAVGRRSFRPSARSFSTERIFALGRNASIAKESEQG